jgi:hypothetical protein
MLAGGDKDAQKMALQAATRPTPVSPAPTTPSPSTSFGGNTSQFTGSFGGNTNQFTGTPTFSPSVMMSSTGKPMPAQPPQPEL